MTTASGDSSQSTRHWQFSLAELLLLFIPVGIGAAFPMLLPLLIPGAALYFTWRLCTAEMPYKVYRFLLPTVWGISTWFSYRNPGDEYGLFGVGALPASWLLALRGAGDIKSMIPSILTCGMISLFLAGWALDRMRVRLWICLPAILILCLSLAGLMISSYPSLSRALAKNGSLTSYFSSALNVSLYSITGLSFVTTPLWRGVVHLVTRRNRPTVAVTSDTPSSPTNGNDVACG